MGPDFTGAIVLVTGSSRGIGKAIAQAFLAGGARVLLHGRSQGSVERARRELGLPPADALVADLTREGDIAAMLREAGGRHGRLDVLVNNAGLALSGPFEGHRADELERLLAVNVRAAQLCFRHALPLFVPGGLVVNISSNVATAPLPLLAAYSASKAALEDWSFALRKEAARSGVQVLVVAPGAVETDMGAAADPSFAARSNRGVVRLQPAAVAEAVLCACRVARRANPKTFIVEHFG